jgi:hypothetical protein
LTLSLVPFPSFLLLSFLLPDSTAAFHDLALTLCSGSLPSQLLLLVNSNSSARVARKRDRMG